ncbi:MAG TPA: hypothetical protein VFB25_02085 [Gaiellaceae bacterium]|nr:hypothetical protein [Gaiellaceae bacterium]
MSWPAIGIVAAAEAAVFFGATVKAFNAESRIDRERDDDIRAAVAGYESGLVLPALTRLVEQVIEVRRPGESVEDALSREDVNRHFVAAVDASVRSRTPRERQAALVHRNNWLTICLVAMHVAGPLSLYNVLTGGYNLPHLVVVVAAVVFCLGTTGALVTATMVSMGERALAKAIGEGKDAA